MNTPIKTISYTITFDPEADLMMKTVRDRLNEWVGIVVESDEIKDQFLEDANGKVRPMGYGRDCKVASHWFDGQPTLYWVNK